MAPRTQRSGQDDSPIPGIEIVEPLDPSERLKQLQAELTQHNTRIDHWSKQRDVLQADITGLSTTVEQVKSTVTNYGSGLKDLHNRFQTLEYFYRQKNKMVLAAVSERKPLIDDLIRGYDDDLARMSDHLRDLEEKQNTAQVESTHAANVQQALENEYDLAADFQQDLTSKLTGMESLRSDITKADDTTDAASMYFLTLEFHSEMRNTKILSQHELSLDLRQKLGELEAAKERARAKTAALSTAQADYAAYKTELDSKRAERRPNLLKDMKALFPVPEQSSDSNGAGAAAPTTPTTAQAATTPAAPAENPLSPTLDPASTPKK